MESGEDRGQLVSRDSQGTVCLGLEQVKYGACTDDRCMYR